MNLSIVCKLQKYPILQTTVSAPSAGVLLVVFLLRLYPDSTFIRKVSASVPTALSLSVPNFVLSIRCTDVSDIVLDEHLVRYDLFVTQIGYKQMDYQIVTNALSLSIKRIHTAYI